VLLEVFDETRGKVSGLALGLCGLFVDLWTRSLVNVVDILYGLGLVINTCAHTPLFGKKQIKNYIYIYIYFFFF
jgi:hypothetical protein